MKQDYVSNRLAEVYLGKDKPKTKPKNYNPKKLFFILIASLCSLILLVIFIAGLTIFGTKRLDYLKSSISVAANLMPIKINYDFQDPFYDRNDFYLELPELDVSSFRVLKLSLKTQSQKGSPVGALKVVLKNIREEIDFFYIKGLNAHWQNYKIPLSEFKDLTDLTKLTGISFVLEAWNTDSEQGTVFIDNVSFSN